jgi:hypothetical protein
MVPSESLAAASIVILAGAVNTVLLEGFVMLTVGGALTITVTALEVLTPLLLSVALAVSE